MGFIVAVDGTAGSGKGTITKIIAEKLNLVSIDTGALYRCVALECINKCIEYTELEKIKGVLENINIELKKENGNQYVFLNGKDVSRDIGTVVFPNADVKVFLDCSVEERAMRRYKQNLEKGIKSTYEEVLESIKERNKLETEREIAPLIKAPDAIYIDSTGMTIDEEVDAVIKVIKEKRGMAVEK